MEDLPSEKTEEAVVPVLRSLAVITHSAIMTEHCLPALAGAPGGHSSRQAPVFRGHTNQREPKRRACKVTQLVRALAL